MQQETLQQLEKKLETNLFTYEDECNFNALSDRYERILNSYAEDFALNDIPEIYQKIKEELRMTHIKEYLLLKEAADKIANIIVRARN